MDNIVTKVECCSSCGRDHDHVEFELLHTAWRSGYTHVGVCPDTGEALLLKQEDESKEVC